jgi:hypothetical protein
MDARITVRCAAGSPVRRTQHGEEGEGEGRADVWRD